MCKTQASLDLGLTTHSRTRSLPPFPFAIFDFRFEIESSHPFSPSPLRPFTRSPLLPLTHPVATFLDSLHSTSDH